MPATDQPRLAAIDFGRDVARLTQDFAGRDWLFDEIDGWLRREGEAQRFFVLVGEPGVGKNAFVARLSQGLSPVGECVAAVHFCFEGRNSTIVPGSVFRSLGAQLVDSLPGYDLALANTIEPEHLSIKVQIDVHQITGGEVKAVVIDHLYAPNPRQVLDILLRAPLAEMDPPAAPCLIVVGGLDAAVTYGGDTNLVRLLADLDDLPPWVRFVCTSQPDRRVLRHFDPAFLHTLDAGSDENLADVCRYVDLRAQKERLCACLQAAGVTPQALADRLVTLSAGNFLYARIVLDDVASGQQRLDDLDALPPGLDTVYHAFLRHFAADDWEERYQPMFGVLAVAREPVTEAQLADFTGLGRTSVRQGLGRMLRFLDAVEDGAGRKTYALFHRSLRDYLLDGDRNEDFWCAPEDGHGSIVDRYWRDGRPDWSGCDDYGLRHVLAHLAGAARWDLVAETVPDLDLWEAQAVRAGLDTVLIGLADVAGKAPPQRDLRPRLFGLLRVLDREAHNLRGWDPAQRPAFFVQQVRNRALDEGMDDLAASAEGRLARLQRPHLSLAWRTHRESPSLARTLVGHGRYVLAVAALPDGRVISGAADGTLRVWDPATGRLACTLAGHDEAVRDLAVTPDGRYAISASFDATLKVWDLEKEQWVRDLAGHDQAVRAVAVTPDGQRAISGSEDCTLIVWDVHTGDVVHRLAAHGRAVWDVALTADGRWAASVGDDGQLVVWDLATGEPVRALPVARRGLRAVAVIPGSHQAIVGARDGSLTVWDLDGGQSVRTLSGHRSAVYAVAVASDGQWAISAANDKTLRVWDLASGAVARTLVGHDGRVWDVAIMPGDRWAISAGDDATLKVWDVRPGAASPGAARPRSGHEAAVRAIILMPDGHTAVSAAANGALHAWDVPAGRFLRRLCGADPAAYWGHGAAVLPDGRRFVSATSDAALTVWDVKGGKPERRLARPLADGESRRGSVVRGLAVTPDGRRAVTAVGDGRLTVWDLESGEAVRTSDGHTGVVRAVAVTAQGDRIISAGDDGALKVWDLPTQALVATLARPVAGGDAKDGAAGLRALALAPDGQVLAGGDDGVLSRWDLETGALVESFPAHEASLRGVAVTKDGRLAVTAAIDRLVKVWDLRTGQELAAVALEGAPRCLALAADGTAVMLGDAAGNVYCFRYVAL